MCMMIYFTQYCIHTVFSVPDLSDVSEFVKASYDQAVLNGTNFSSACFALYNLVCFLVAIIIGLFVIASTAGIINYMVDSEVITDDMITDSLVSAK